ncbi:MAG: YfhO family protein [Candidatus Levybacteria bacterium]|nr:YfhO family protein [Candidatus Levybacteria bacterium]
MNVLFLIFPQIDVWVLLIVIEPIIAGSGMFLFLDRIVSSKKSAAFGALAFAFSGIVIVRAVEGLSVGHTLIWMPYPFWGIESFNQTKKLKYLWLILLSLSLSLLAGWFQFTVYIFIFSLAYALYKLSLNSSSSKAKYALLLPFLVFPFVTLFHTIPAIQTLLESPRFEIEGRLFSSRHLMPLSHILTLIIPDLWGNPAVYNYFGRSDYKESILFIGIAPLIFFLLTAFKRKTKEELFFIIAVVISLALAIDSLFSRFIITSPIQVFSSFLPNRVFLITTFSFCVLAACGFDYLLKKKKIAFIKTVKNNSIFILLIFIIIGSFLITIVMQDTTVLYKTSAAAINTSPAVIQLRNSAVPLGFLFITIILIIAFRNNYSRNIFFVAIVIVLFWQSYLFSQKYIPFSYRQFVYPDNPVFTYLKQHQQFDRFMSVGFGHIVPSIPLQFNLYSPEGIGSMYIRRYGEFVRYMKLADYGIPDKIAFDLEIYSKEVFNNTNNRLYRFFELTSVKHIVVDRKSIDDEHITPKKANFVLKWQNERWQIYEYNRKKILYSLFKDTFNPQKIILEEDPGFSPKEGSGSAKVIMYSPNKIEVKVKTNDPSLLYISDTYSKMFKVFIDGREGKILRANYTFRAISIPKGEHQILMVYNDSSFKLGLKIAVFIFFLSGMVIFIFRKYF